MVFLLRFTVLLESFYGDKIEHNKLRLGLLYRGRPSDILVNSLYNLPNYTNGSLYPEYNVLWKCILIELFDA